MAFNIKDFLSEESKKEVINDFPIEKIAAKHLHPSEKNFYKIDHAEIEVLKNSIELIGVQENLIVKEIPEKHGEYEILAGHKRYTAVSELLKEGREVSEYLPCKVDYSGSSAIRELILIFTNSTQRERSDYEKMYEIQRVRELLEEYGQKNELPGRKRDIIAQILNTSKSSIARLDNIRRNIIPEFMQEYQNGNIATATANELAGVSNAGQKALWQQYEENRSIATAAVKTVKEREKANEPLPGQVSIEDYEEMQEPEETKEEIKVTVERQQDNTDRETLIISGKINPNKEYNGMNISYFVSAVTNSDLFDSDFWKGWTDPAGNKATLLKEYMGLIATFNSSTGEPCGCGFTDKGFTVERKEAQAVASICLKEFAELITALIVTKVVKIETEPVDVSYWGKQTAREIAARTRYLTGDELAVLQEIALKLKERAGE